MEGKINIGKNIIIWVAILTERYYNKIKSNTKITLNYSHHKNKYKSVIYYTHLYNK
jgi:hypothetical protein